MVISKKGIKSTFEDCYTLAQIVDSDSNLPRGPSNWQCSCGGIALQLVNYDNSQVECVNCSTIFDARKIGATITVSPIISNDSGDRIYYAPNYILAQIDAAKGKPANQRTNREKALANVKIVDLPTQAQVPPNFM